MQKCHLDHGLLVCAQRSAGGFAAEAFGVRAR
jgi:hypothetical protein